ncbi:MAG: hypothetical protein KBC33_01480 [Candidatus Pacebacteria bacterium]|nr:hypothetical protein [Candidatus Paceibacterota bacterium]
MSTRSNYRRIESKRGFIAVTAVILLAMGCIATVMIAFTTSASYADSVTRREYRIQKAMNAEACQDIRELMLAKDYFFVGSVIVAEFGCIIEE